MLWMSRVDRMTMPLRRFIGEAMAPEPATLPHPLFSDRLKDRQRRWTMEKQPNPYSRIASKQAGQAYMRSLGYAVPELYGTYPTIDEIPRFEDLPRNFVLKPTSGWSGAGVFLMREGVDAIRKRGFTRDELISTAKAFSGAGRPGIAGKWIAEELVLGNDGEPALDHKFFCFGPKVACIQINRRTGLEQPFYQYWFRDADWQPLRCRISWDKYPERSALPKPPCFDEMLKIALDVASRLNIFVRVDLLASDRGPVFGEFTSFPHAGKNYTPRADAWLGSFWQTQDGGD